MALSLVKESWGSVHAVQAKLGVLSVLFIKVSNYQQGTHDSFNGLITDTGVRCVLKMQLVYRGSNIAARMMSQGQLCRMVSEEAVPPQLLRC